ncbi:zinc finger protein 250-like isoform X1 [Gigantopelta aegis]|uniref:zinc finger protein 250-like isoform X1 n=1 Tax=Gigantopelta aegis TaxID=1735272 RepID=UPI001B888606|nr:zinc finger protein 250-like isoform X1 [Gigantopelta aegis]
MQSRQMRKLQYVRHAGHAADKWLHQRKVDLGVIFESWKSLRDKRADTDPGLAFHLMEIHDQYCFCRFEESESTVRDGDLVGSYDVSEYSKHSQETDEVIDRFSNSSTPDTPGFSQKQETSDVSNSVDPGNRSSDQQHESKVETLSRPRDTFDDSSSPPVNEAYVNEPTLPPREHSVLPDKLTSPQTSGYSPIISVSIGSPHAPTQPAYVFQSENMPEQSDSALATLYRPADSDLRVKAEPIAIDSEPDESDDVPRVSHIPGMTTSAGETPGHNLQRQQLTTDRPEQPWFCHLCPKSYHNKKSLTRHVKHHEGAKLECHVCFKKFFARWELQQHIESHTDCFLCTVCGKSFNWAKSLKRHFRQSHAGTKDFHCNHCKASFKDHNGLCGHKLNHCVKSFLCSRCGAEFRFRKSLQFHEMNVCVKRLKAREGFTFKCGSCGKAFKTRRLLDQHELLHKPPAFKCHGCGKLFTYRTSLRYHMRSCQACMLILFV